MTKQALILCGGLGTRLRPITNEIPKCMVEIDKNLKLPFLDYLIDNLSSQGIKDLILCCGYKREHIMNYFRDGSEHNVDIQYSIETEPLGTAGAIRNASQLLDREFYILNGDTFIDYPLQQLSDNFKICDKIGIMLVYDNRWHKVASNNVLLDDTQILSYMIYPASYLNGVDTGVGIWSKDLLEYIPEGNVPMADVYYKLVKERQLSGLMTDRRYYDIGTPERLKIFMEYIKCGTTK